MTENNQTLVLFKGTKMILSFHIAPKINQKKKTTAKQKTYETSFPINGDCCHILCSSTKYIYCNHYMALA